MVQHLLIIDIAALLLVLGLTGPMLQPLLAIRWLRWIRALAHPVVSFLLWAAILYVWHIPALYQAATFDSPLLHAVEHATFLLRRARDLALADRTAAEARLVRQRGQGRST